MPRPDREAILKTPQTLVEARLIPTGAAAELLVKLQQTRPWNDEGAVASRLRRWADKYWGEGALAPGDADGAAEVAEILAQVGRATEEVDDATVARLTSTMLRRVAQGRSPTSDDPVSDRVLGYPRSTTYRWELLARDASCHDDGGLSQAVARIQRELDLDTLEQKGYSRPNARLWRQRNPGKLATEAPRPRRRRRRGDAGKESEDPGT